MTSDYEKTLSQSGFAGGGTKPPFGWSRPALAAAVVGFVLSSCLLYQLSVRLPDRPVVRLWLGLLPLHGVALGAALAVLIRYVPRGLRPAALDMDGRALAVLRHNPGGNLLRIAGIYLVSTLIAMVTAFILLLFGHPPPPMPLLELLLHDPSTALFLTVFVAAVIIAPVSEEILFRVVLFDAARPYGHRPATIAAAFIFALAHGSLTHLPALFFLGLVLQAIRSRSGSLWACIAAHAVFNGLTFLALGIWFFGFS